MNRVVYLVDGFNLYHSLREVERGHGHSLRWLDLNALCSSLLHAVPGRCEVAGIVYFSAMARHRETARPGTVGSPDTFATSTHSKPRVSRRSSATSSDGRCVARIAAGSATAGKRSRRTLASRSAW